MPLKLKVGDTFPSLSLTSDRGQSISIAEIADGRPLMLAFYRGPW
jgi:peroxiredoxin